MSDAISIMSGMKTNKRVQQLAHKRLAQRVTTKAGYSIDNFHASDVTELYYDLFKGSEDVGCISKGWDDPGFRIGDIVIPRTPLYVTHHVLENLREYTATNGVGATISRTDSDHHIYID